MVKLRFATCPILAVATTAISCAQTFTTLASFSAPNGVSPCGPLIQGFDGNLYGTAESSIAFGTMGGAIFRVTPAGSLATLYSFCSLAKCADGYGPWAGLALSADGNFYGETGYGGVNQYGGTFFQISSSGSLTTVFNFSGKTGVAPLGTLLLGTNGNLYGSTAQGAEAGNGTLFEITPQGSLTTLHYFTGGADGSYPDTSLVEGGDGKLYGVTYYGGAYGSGTIFAVAHDGTLTTLHSFSGSDGSHPMGLMAASDGNLYGTTQIGAAGGGTVFRLTPAGTLTTLYQFNSNGPQGANPQSPVIQGTDGNFYGTTALGGAAQNGTIFRITPAGALTVLHSFSGADGSAPWASLLQATDGNFYGSTHLGGAFNGGTVFKLAMGLAPFVTTLPRGGAAGTAVIILGTNLAGASGISFNGTPAAFTIISPTQITATVPTGATTGRVQVTTPRGKLESNGAFFVR